MTGSLTGKRVLVPRPIEQASSLVAGLARVGAEPVVVPLIEIGDPPDGGAALSAAAAQLDGYAWIVVASPNAASRLTGAARSVPAGARVAAVGPSTARVLHAAEWQVDLLPTSFVAEGLVEAFPDPPPEGGRVLVPQPRGARPMLADGLKAKGWSVELVEAYSTTPVELDDQDRAAIARCDVAAFTSASTVIALVDAIGPAAVPPIVACIGPITAEAAAGIGVAVDVIASVHTVDGLVAALVAHVAG